MQTCTLRDLRARGRRRGGRDRPGGRAPEVVAPQMVERDRAGGALLRGAADRRAWRSRRRGPTSGSAPPTGPRPSRAADPGTPHNEARDQVWEELLAILVDKVDDEEVPPRAAAPRARPERRAASTPSARPGRCSTRPTSSATCGRCPAYLRLCAPWLDARRGADACSARTRRPGRCPTCRCSTPPGSGSATRTPRGAGSAQRGGPRRRARGDGRDVVDHLIATDDDGHDDHVDAARAGPPGRAGRRGRCADRGPGRCSPARSRTSSSTRRRS